MSAKIDYYELLEISKTANDQEIKTSYRKLAMQCHPDKNPGCKVSEEKFKKITEAYEILKDPQKRAAYDKYGHAAFENGGAGGGNPFGFDFGFGTGDFSDVFSNIFSDFMGGGRTQSHDPNAPRKGQDLQYELTMTLEEAFSGLEKEIRIKRTKECKKCNGFGTKNAKPADVCSNCKGSGRVRVQRGFFIMEDACPKCKGEGCIVKEACSECHGNGYLEEYDNIKISIPEGIENGSRVRLSGGGNSGLRGGPAGDLYIYVNVKRHKIYEREGANLYTEIPISMFNAALGTKVELPWLNGEKITVDIPSGAQYGTQIKIKGKGMPYIRSKNIGDLIVQLKVEIPKKLSEQQKKLLEELRDISEDESSKSFLDKVKDLFSKVS